MITITPHNLPYKKDFQLVVIINCAYLSIHTIFSIFLYLIKVSLAFYNKITWIEMEKGMQCERERKFTIQQNRIPSDPWLFEKGIKCYTTSSSRSRVLLFPFISKYNQMLLNSLCVLDYLTFVSPYCAYACVCVCFMYRIRIVFQMQ